MINFSSRIPSAYQEVEYLKSSGTQYINTGVIPTVDTGVKVRGHFTSVQNENNIILGASDQTAFANGKPYSVDPFPDKVYFPFGGFVGNSTDTLTITQIANTQYEYTLNYMDSGKASVDTLQMTLPTRTSMTSKALYLFCLNGNGTAGYYSHFALEYLQITQGESVIHDYVPCYRKADNVAGLYDLVTGTFYTNAGTGSFTVGANVSGSIEITTGSFIPKHFALRRRMMAIAAPAGFEWIGWANATWEDVYNLCKAKQKGKINAWPSDVVLGATKETTLSTPILGTSTFTMRIIGLDIDGSGVITFDSKYGTLNSIRDTSLNTYQNNFYNYCNAKPYIKALSKGTAATNFNRNGVVTYADYYVWSLSEREVNLDKYSGISVANSTPTKAECTYGVNKPYPYFTSDDKRKKIDANNSFGYAWRLRSVSKFGTDTVVFVTNQGSSNYSNTSADYIRFSPCFAIG